MLFHGDSIFGVLKNVSCSLVFLKLNSRLVTSRGRSPIGVDRESNENAFDTQPRICLISELEWVRPKHKMATIPSRAICWNLVEVCFYKLQKPQTCPFSGTPYVENMKIQGVKILLNRDWQSSLDWSTPRQLSPQLKKKLNSLKPSDSKKDLLIFVRYQTTQS